MLIGEKIKQLIAQSKMSKEEAAAALGISVSNLYNLYKRDSVETKYLEVLSKLFNVDVSYFIESSTFQVSESGVNIQHIGIEKEKSNKEDQDIRFLRLEIEKLRSELQLKDQIIELLKQQLSK